MQDLENQILTIFRRVGAPLTMGVLEAYITVQNNSRVDTFDVRDAVHKLVQEGKLYQNLLYDIGMVE